MTDFSGRAFYYFRCFPSTTLCIQYVLRRRTEKHRGQSAFKVHHRIVKHIALTKPRPHAYFALVQYATKHITLTVRNPTTQRNPFSVTVATFAGMVDQEPSEGVEDLYLFDPKVIDQVDLTRAKCTFNPPVHSARDPAPGVQLRPLSSKDYDRGKQKACYK